MALELHVVGPGVDVSRPLEAGEPALIIGRDSDCAICLPDPERSVSRHHLSVWNDADRLHFHVLSAVNGVQTRAGELPPGSRGVLADDDAIALSAFRVTARVAAPGSPGFMDTWARLQHEAERLAPPGDPTLPPPEEDPFGDWGFSSTFGTGPASSADGLAPASDLRPFLAGLGLDAVARPTLTCSELETIGRITRIALQGLVQASQAAAGSREEARVEDQTVADRREPNPLRTDMPLEDKLRYLVDGAAAAAGMLPPERAVAQLAGELLAHEQAMGQAVQETVRAVLAEFEPEALRKRLLGAGPRLFESARAWDAFVRDYAEHSGPEADWVRQLLGRHFARAYARALLRAKRNTAGPPGG